MTTTPMDLVSAVGATHQRAKGLLAAHKEVSELLEVICKRLYAVGSACTRTKINLANLKGDLRDSWIPVTDVNRLVEMSSVAPQSKESVRMAPEVFAKVYPDIEDAQRVAEEAASGYEAARDLASDRSMWIKAVVLQLQFNEGAAARIADEDPPTGAARAEAIQTSLEDLLAKAPPGFRVSVAPPALGEPVDYKSLVDLCRDLGDELTRAAEVARSLAAELRERAEG